MTESMFYDPMTGERTELGKKFGFPKGGTEKHPLQYEDALEAYKYSTALRRYKDDEAQKGKQKQPRFYDNKTGELTELGKKYGFPERGAKKYDGVLQRFKEGIRRVTQSHKNAEAQEDKPKQNRFYGNKTGGLTEQQTMEFAAKIDRIEMRGGAWAVYFKGFYEKDLDNLRKSFAELGATVCKEELISLEGSRITEYMFLVNYKNMIDDLMRKQERIHAWETLRGWGGIQMTSAEKTFFAAEDLRMAERKSGAGRNSW